jgi:transposase-like protein
MEAMEAVLEELDLMEKKNIQKIANKHSVERSTLSRRYYGKTTTKAEGYNS